jgi:hypothetical protein
MDPNIEMGPNGVEVLSQAEMPSIPAPEETPAEIARQGLLKWGLLGVALGAVLTGGITALTFSSYRRTDSALGPALWATAGSFAIGGGLLWILSSTVERKVDDRVVAAAVGAKLAV